MNRLRAAARLVFRFAALAFPSVILWFLSGSATLGISFIAVTAVGAVVFNTIGLQRLLRWIDWVSSHIPFGGAVLGPVLRSARIAAEVLPAVSHPDTKGGLYRRVALLLEEASR